MLHQNSFHKLLQEFKKETLLTYFINKQTFIFMDAHKTGLSAILAQGENVNNAKQLQLYQDPLMQNQLCIPVLKDTYNNANNVEKVTAMKTKTAHLQNKNEVETLNLFLVNCQDTPYLSTSAVPTHMLEMGTNPIYPIRMPVKKLSFCMGYR